MVSLPENFSFQKMGKTFFDLTRKAIEPDNIILLRLARFVNFITVCFESDKCQDENRSESTLRHGSHCPDALPGGRD